MLAASSSTQQHSHPPNESFSDEEREPFSQIADAFEGNDGESEHEETMVLKIRELQKICLSLSKTNERLMERVEELEEERQINKSSINRNINNITHSFTDEYSEMQCDFNDIEEIIKEYRNDLKNYQQAIQLQQRQFKDSLKKSLEELKEAHLANQQLTSDNNALQAMVQGLEENNEQLLLEIERMDVEMKNAKTMKRSTQPEYRERQNSFQRRNVGRENFDQSVEEELEKLIEKLVKELEYEKNTKKKLKIEIKRLQGALVQSQKQIMSRNSKIYVLELNSIISSKQAAQSSMGILHKTIEYGERIREGSSSNREANGKGKKMQRQIKPYSAQTQPYGADQQ